MSIDSNNDYDLLSELHKYNHLWLPKTKTSRRKDIRLLI